MKILFSLTTLVVFAHGLFAQDGNGNFPGSWNETTFQPSKEEVKIMKKLKADKLVRVFEEDDELFFLRDAKTLKWGLFQNYAGLKELVPMRYDSIKSPGHVFHAVFKNGKCGIYLSPLQFEKSWESVPCNYEDYFVSGAYGNHCLAMKLNGKWAWVDWVTGKEKIPFTYESPGELPYPAFDEKYDYYISFPLEETNKRMGGDKIELDFGNEDWVFSIRMAGTQKWGLYQLMDEKKAEEIIPPLYDSLVFFPSNHPYTFVFNQGKMGVFLSRWNDSENARQTVPCEYEAYYEFYYKWNYYLALKKDGKWGWVDWKTGEAKSGFVYETEQALPTPVWE